MCDDLMFIGIDPSINSTGIVIRLCDNELHEKYIKYYILKGDTHKITKTGKITSPLTKAEMTAQEKYDNFNYVLYNKVVSNKDAESSDIEYNKTISFMSLTQCIVDLIKKEQTLADNPKTYVAIEGISYGSSIRTQSIFDLAGLNFMIRCSILSIVNKLIIIPPSHVKKFATGVGNANKEIIIEMFKAVHPDFDIPKIDDIADAFFISRISQQFI